MQSILRFIDQKKVSIIVLVLVDAVFFFISFFLAYFFRNFIGEEIQTLNVYLTALPVSFVIMVIVFYFFRLYEQRIRIEGISEIYTVTKAILFTAVLLMAASFLYKYDYSRGFIIIFVLFGIVFLNFGRILVRIVRKQMIKRGRGIKRILIVGAGRPGRKLAKQLEKYKEFGYKLVGFVDDHVKSKNILDKLKNLSKAIKKNKIDIVFVSNPMISHNTILEIMSDCENLNVKFKLVSSLYEILAGNIDINEIEEIPSIDIKTKKASFFYRVIKRLIDIVLSALGLIILSPLWLIIVVLIRLDSKGKAHFVHERVGLNGSKFNLWKFRTMKSDSKKYETAPIKKNDPRVTRIGKFLRKTSLDELPQLINVLKGEMSLVGPRPEMPFIVKQYTGWQRKRLEVKPGLTGLWQILGRKDLPLHENLEYDFYYIQNQSLLLDLVIMVKTIWTVITGKGAY